MASAVVYFFVTMILRRFVPDNLLGEPAKPLTIKTLAEKDEGASA